MIACSSAKVFRSWPATYVAKEEEEDVADGIVLGP